MKKNNTFKIYSLGLVIVISMFSVPASLFAAPFTSPGPLDPGCAPTDEDCYVDLSQLDTVKYPISYTFNNAYFVEGVSPSNSSLSSSSGSMVAVDVTGDGQDDIVVAGTTASAPGSIEVFVQNGSILNTVTSYELTEDNLNPRYLDYGDFNDDGHEDIVFNEYNASSGKFGILLNQGDGTFDTSETIIINTSEVFLTDFDVVDDDGDGDLDIIGTRIGPNAATTFMFVLRNDGSNSFTKEVGPGTSYYPVQVEAHQDLDQDGDLDFITMTSYGPFIYLKNAEGDFEFDNWAQLGASGTSLYSDNQNFAIIDFNNDSYPDLLITQQHNPIFHILLNDGTGSYPMSSLQSFNGPGCGSCNNAYGYDIEVSDLNDDGYEDVVYIISSIGGGVNVTHIYLNNKQGGFVFWKELQNGDDATSLVLTDINADGSDDIVVLVPGINDLEYFVSSSVYNDTDINRLGATLNLSRGDRHIGIGERDPDYLLHVTAGAGVVAGFENVDGLCTVNPSTSSFSCSSDQRLKKNITSLEAVLPNLLSLNAVTYLWNKDTELSEKKIGFIAQNVQEFFPQLVQEQADGYLGVNYSGFSPVLVASLQELYVMINDLRPILAEDQESVNMAFNSFLHNSKSKVVNGVVSIAKLVGDIAQFRIISTEEVHIQNQFCLDGMCINSEQFKQLLESNGVEYSTEESVFSFDDVEFQNEVEGEIDVQENAPLISEEDNSGIDSESQLDSEQATQESEQSVEGSDDSTEEAVEVVENIEISSEEAGVSDEEDLEIEQKESAEVEKDFEEIKIEDSETLI